MTQYAVTEFLRLILPATGSYNATVLPQARSVWSEGIPDLASKIAALDVLGEGIKDYGVHHACASFKEPTTRKQDNIHRLKTFLLDIDAGPTKPYATMRDAKAAVDTFCATLGLPIPIFIASGYGVHAYWPLDTEIDIDTWRPYAAGLKALCVSNGLQADAQRTTHPGTTLRSLGTFNRKDPANPKRVGWSGPKGPYTLAQLRAFLDAAPKVVKKKVVSSITANAEQVADLCAQLGAMRSSGGVMPEPDWKACLNVLAFCMDGESTAHRWSEGDPRYNKDETQKKFAASKTLSGPSTCAHFSSLNDKCTGCRFKGHVTAPTQLGVGDPLLAEGRVEIEKELDIKGITLPSIGGFSHVGGSLVYKQEGKDGKELVTRISQYPIVVEALIRGELTGDSYSVLLKHATPHDGWREVAIPVKLLFGSGGASEAMGRGIVIHHAELFKQYMRESMDRINAMKGADIQYDQFGWKDSDRAFLFGDRLYTSTDVKRVAGSQEVQRRSVGLGPRRNGSIGAWKEAASKLFAPGYEAQGFAVLASFAAPFMKWQSPSEGGAILSLVSKSGGQGKSTALAAAASVWGLLEDMKQTNTDTRVAKGIVMGVMGNLPILRDEYSQRDPEILKEEVQIFTEGRDKQRGTSDGGLMGLGASWQTVMITASNTSVCDTLGLARNGTAMADRVVEFVVAIPKTTEHWKGEGLKRQLEGNAGHAGDLFLRYILQPEIYSYVRNLVDKVREDLIKKHGLTTDKRFVARLFAGVAVAGAVVRQAGLLDVSADRIMEWAAETLFTDEWYSKDAPSQPRYEVGRFLTEHIQNTLVVQDKFERGGPRSLPLKEPTRSLIIRQEVKTERVYISKNILKKWVVNAGLTWKDFMSDLHKSGCLLSDNRLITLSAGSDYTSGQVQCIELDRSHEILRPYNLE